MGTALETALRKYYERFRYEAKQPHNSIDFLLDSLEENGIKFSDEIKQGINGTIDMLVKVYGEKERKYEKGPDNLPLPEYSHPIAVLYLAVGFYLTEKDNAKKDEHAKRFIKTFEENPLVFIYSALLHDVLEDEKMSETDLHGFLREKAHLTEQQTKAVVDDCNKLYHGEIVGDNILELNQVLNILRKGGRSAYVKCFDIMHNSYSVPADDEKMVEKMMEPYYEFVKGFLPRIASIVMRNALQEGKERYFARLGGRQI